MNKETRRAAKDLNRKRRRVYGRSVAPLILAGLHPTSKAYIELVALIKDWGPTHDDALVRSFSLQKEFYEWGIIEFVGINRILAQASYVVREGFRFRFMGRPIPPEGLARVYIIRAEPTGEKV